MNFRIFYLALGALLLQACAQKPKPSAFSAALPSGSIRTEEQAINVVRHHIQRNGGDPSRHEINAMWNGQWRVAAWYVVYPNNIGSNRFVPGCQTYYTVSPDGRITDTMAGL